MALAWTAALAIAGIWLSMLVKMAVAALAYFIIMKAAHAQIMEECLAYVFKRKSNKEKSE